MIDLDRKIGWHPKFTKKVISRNEIILIGENNDHLFTNDKHKRIINLANGSKKVSQFIDEIPSFIEKASFLYSIKTLIDKEILAPLQSEKETLYHLPKKTKDIEIHDDVTIYNLSHISSTLLQNISISKKNISLIFIDNYLDPRLHLINKKHVHSQRPYVLIKLTGSKPMIGPFLSMKKKQPCWKCLSNQLLQNRPILNFLLKKNVENYISHPIYLQNVEIDLKWVTTVINDTIKNENTCFEINLQNNIILKKHIVHNKPQCSICGDRLLLKKQLQSPVNLHSCLKKEKMDGGSRSMSPDETLEKLDKYISSITGVISGLSFISKKKQNTITIYKSAYFKTPSPQEIINNSSFRQISLGKGIVNDQSKVSALCESIERYAALYQGDEFYIKSAPDNLNKRYYLPSQLAKFSKNQYQDYIDNKLPSNILNHLVNIYDTTIPLHWTLTWSLTKEEFVYLPFNHCFSNTPFDQDKQYIHWSSNGCAAGNSIEEAIIQGFYELIERDASAIWWYNKIERPLIDLSTIQEGKVFKIHETLKDEWDYWALDITNDFDIPTIAAIAQHKKTGVFCFGFGCHLNIETACTRALTELCQLIPVREQKNAPFDFNAIKEEQFLKGNGNKKKLSSYQNNESKDIKNDIIWGINKAKTLGFELLVTNYSRPDLPIKTVKVTIPGLCFIWPQLGNERLYNLPIKLGWSKQKLQECELNEMGLYV